MCTLGANMQQQQENKKPGTLLGSGDYARYYMPRLEGKVEERHCTALVQVTEARFGLNKTSFQDALLRDIPNRQHPGPVPTLEDTSEVKDLEV